MHIKIDGNNYIILEDSYTAIPRNVYSQAKRVKGPSLQMVKVILGTVYDIEVSIIDLNKDTASQLQKSILKTGFDVEFYDTDSKAYKTQNCYAPDTKLKIKRTSSDMSKIYYDVVELVLTANQAADWVVT